MLSFKTIEIEKKERIENKHKNIRLFWQKTDLKSHYKINKY